MKTLCSGNSNVQFSSIKWKAKSIIGITRKLLGKVFESVSQCRTPLHISFILGLIRLFVGNDYLSNNLQLRTQVFVKNSSPVVKTTHQY